MNTTDTSDLDLFIVHAEADAAFVRGYLLPALELPRDRVLLIDELPLGGLMVSEIDRGVSRSRYTVAVLSPAYLQDRWADFGVELASHVSRRDARVVPLRLLDCELPARLDARVALDFRDKDRWEWETARLRDLLRRPAPDGAVVPYPAPRRHAHRRRLSAGLASVSVSASIVLAAARPWPAPRATAPPSPEMVRFEATRVQSGLDAARMPAACRALAADEGCPAADQSEPEPIGPASVAAFELDRREVTNGEYANWLNANPSFWKLASYGIVTTRGESGIPLIRTEKCGDGLTINPDLNAQVTGESARWPVACVTWSGADEYCRAHGKRLPLNSEWSVAATGAGSRPFPWGAELPRSDVVAFRLRGSAAVHPQDVGSSPQDVSPEGVYDLGGNIAEWVDDGRRDAGMKPLRGGGFGSRSACDLLSSRCTRVGGDSSNLDVGFRCARSVIERQLDEGRS